MVITDTLQFDTYITYAVRCAYRLHKTSVRGHKHFT